MQTVCFRIKPQSSLDDAWDEIESFSCMEPLYSSEDPEGIKEIYANVERDFEIPALKHVLDYYPTDLEAVDWEKQWQLHGMDYREGCIHVNLANFGCKSSKWKELKLEPGPGFGDLSHTTTRLVLEMMSNVVVGQYVLDIGSGSGILALSALAMGAKNVFGVDIDSEAIAHARNNADLNAMSEHVKFGFAKDFKVPFGLERVIILMNMIQAEQEQAWASLKFIHGLRLDCLISGILVEERERYLAKVADWGWDCINEVEKDGWLGLHFVKN